MLRRGAQRLSTRSEGWVLPIADLRVRCQDARHHMARSASIDVSRYLPHRSVTRISAILSVRHVAPRWRDGADDHRRHIEVDRRRATAGHTDRRSNQLSGQGERNVLGRVGPFWHPALGD